MGAPKGISRQVSIILGAKRLPKGSPGGSKIELGRRPELKMAKTGILTNVFQNSFIFEVPGPPKTSPKLIQNGFQIASSTRRPSESLWRASWSALGGLRSRKKEVGNDSWAAWAQKKCQNWGPKSDPKTLQDASRDLQAAKTAPRALQDAPGSILDPFWNRFKVDFQIVLAPSCVEKAAQGGDSREQKAEQSREHDREQLPIQVGGQVASWGPAVTPALRAQ